MTCKELNSRLIKMSLKFDKYVLNSFKPEKPTKKPPVKDAFEFNHDEAYADACKQGEVY